MNPLETRVMMILLMMMLRPTLLQEQLVSAVLCEIYGHDSA
jgi:hypothetical protein